MPKKFSPPAVLVVEDDPLVRLDVALAMSDAGFAVIEVPNADEALDILETRDTVGVVFTDVEMPGRLDGLKLAAIIAERWPHIPVLVTSGHRKGESIEPGHFFPKPYDSREVISTVRCLS